MTATNSTGSASTAAPAPAAAAGDPLWLRVLGRTLGISFMVGGLVTTVLLLRELDLRPRTDDAFVRANVIGIAAHVAGPIVELHVEDNQPVSAGDLLFVVDPRPYEAALAVAQAQLLLVDSEIAAFEAQIEAARRGVASAAAAVARAEAEAVYSVQYLERVEPLLASRFVTPDAVEEARTTAAAKRAGVAVAEAQLDQAEADLLVAIANLADVGEINARRAGAAAALAKAELYLEYCFVRSPIDGYITNLNISRGEYANTGQQVFAIVDRSVWFVMASFLETDLPFIEIDRPVEIYLMARPGERLLGRVQGIGWALFPPDGATSDMLPKVSPTLDWVRLAQRFPVRIIVESEPSRPLRMGETASVIVLPEGNAAPPPRFPAVRSLFNWIGFDD
jgi:multidrug efflux system membrane fusion protein